MLNQYIYLYVSLFMNMCIVCVSACGERENASISVISVHIMGRGKKLRVRLDLKGQVS